MTHAHSLALDTQAKLGCRFDRLQRTAAVTHHAFGTWANHCWAGDIDQALGGVDLRPRRRREHFVAVVARLAKSAPRTLLEMVVVRVAAAFTIDDGLGVGRAIHEHAHNARTTSSEQTRDFLIQTLN